MSDQGRRQLVAHGAIGVAVCLGAYMGLVDGPRKSLQTTRAEVQGLQTQVQLAESLRDRIPSMSKALESAEKETARLAQLGQAARDERGLFAAMMSLAATHHVRLDELNPVRPGAPAAARDKDKPGAPADVAVGYSMAAVGAYEDVAGFLAAIGGELGFVAIRSVRLTPVQDDKARLVHAAIETEHYSFDVSAHEGVADAGGH